jgi:hypothetical protein
MSDVILRGTPVSLESDVGLQFVTDCTRAAEGLYDDKELTEKYELSPLDWTNLVKDKELERAIRRERESRVRSGQAAREAAQKHFIKAPTILAGIMESAGNPRHVIEAAREIRSVASGGAADRPGESGRFIIRIDLSADGTNHVETFNKSIEVNAADEDGPNEGSPNNLIPSKGKPDDQW